MTHLRSFLFIASFLFLTLLAVPSFGAFEQEHVSKPLLMNSPEHYYNDALEAEARGDFADASLALRRALVLHPRFPQAQQKFSQVLSKLGISNQPSWKNKLTSLISLDLLVLSGSLIAWSSGFLSVWFLFKRYFSAKSTSKKKPVLLFACILLIFFLGVGMVFVGTVLDPRTNAPNTVIVLPPYDLKTSTGDREDRPATTPLRATPVDNAMIIAQIPTGSALLLQSRHGVWSYVKMESGQEGWIASSVLQPLVPNID
ncbi:MAG: hypothetical protein ACOYK6_01500 [Chthoniobacterales bacterium]